MPSFSLHADYDRNGVMNATPAEYARRMQIPGAVVTPNLDVDGLSLPRTVSCGSPPRLDKVNRTKPGNENDLLPFSIKATVDTVIGGFTAKLKLTDDDAKLVEIYDSSKQRINGLQAIGFVVFDINLTGLTTNFFLEAITIAGSPLLTNPLTRITSIELILEISDAVTNQTVETDRCLVTPSPLILLGDHARPERIYMCKLFDERSHNISDNLPSFTDANQAVRLAMRSVITTIPATVSNGDSWIQDQFQCGYLQSTYTNMKVMLHLPRLRSDTRITTGTNGLMCMSTGHFPSSNLGVFNDFWERTIEVVDSTFNTQNISFLNSAELILVFEKAWKLFDYLKNIIRELCDTQFKKSTPFAACITNFHIDSKLLKDDMLSIIINMVALKNSITVLLRNAISASNEESLNRRYQNTITDIGNQVSALLREVMMRDKLTMVIRTQNISLSLDISDIPDFIEKLFKMHSSHNYGGNIEVSPPLPSAPLGKILIGDSIDPSSSEMDPDLISFFVAQGKQPIVRIDTTWLKVGHVDELFNFGGVHRGEFSIFMASSDVASDLLKECFNLNTAHLNENDPAKDQRPLTIGDFEMARGPHPVTRMLRGKLWLHSYRDTQPLVVPPQIYRDMSSYFSDYGISSRPYFPVPSPDDHYYDARISVREMIYFSQYSLPTVIEKTRDAKGILMNEFQGKSILELPLFFDEFDISDEQKTIAFTPDLVNFQTLNNHVLVPRPFGPRMSATDAITVLRNVLPEELSRGITRQWLERRNLHKTFNWTIDTYREMVHMSDGTYTVGVFVTIDWLVRQFEDGFKPAITDRTEIARRIRNANPGAFLPDGRLKTGWHKIEIPENKVDIFEAYTQVVMESAGLTVHWVDSWYYHLRSGGIHCGTNVIRTPDLSPSRSWWNI